MRNEISTYKLNSWCAETDSLPFCEILKGKIENRAFMASATSADSIETDLLLSWLSEKQASAFDSQQDERDVIETLKQAILQGDFDHTEDAQWVYRELLQRWIDQNIERWEGYWFRIGRDESQTHIEFLRAFECYVKNHCDAFDSSGTFIRQQSVDLWQLHYLTAQEDIEPIIHILIEQFNELMNEGYFYDY